MHRGRPRRRHPAARLRAELRGGIEAAGRGYVLMADADDSYALDDIRAFIEALRAGADLVMGNRFLGGIEHGFVNAGTAWYCQTGGSASETGRRTCAGTGGGTRSSWEPARNLADLGRTAVHALGVDRWGDSEAG